MKINTLIKSDSCHNLSNSFLNKNKSYFTNKTAFTNAYTHKPTSPQTSIFYSKSKTSSHYHDSFHSLRLQQQPSQNKHSLKHLFLTKTNNSVIIKDSSQMNIRSLRKGSPFKQQQQRPSTAFRKNTNQCIIKSKSTSPHRKRKHNHIEHNNKTAATASQQIQSLFKKGLTEYEYAKIKHYSIDEANYAKQAFPMISSKKVVKNILPKEYNFIKEKTPDEVLRNAYHPVVRFQKKMLNKHINNINKEINFEYSHTFSLVKKGNFSKKFRMAEDLIDLEKDTKLMEIIDKLIQNNFKLGNEIDTVIEQNRKQEEKEKKIKLYFKFKRTLIRAAIHFQRLDISLLEFLSMRNPLHIKPYEHKESYALICAIKNRDIDTICRMVRENYFLVFDFDNFHQTPLHWASKRNLYEVISLMASKGANVSAQDSVGHTPLHIAAKFNHIEALQILLYEISNPLIQDNHGLLPFDLTNDPVIQFILQRAASLHKIRSGMNYLAYIKSIKHGLEYLFMEELKTNFDQIKLYLYK